MSQDHVTNSKRRTLIDVETILIIRHFFILLMWCLDDVVTGAERVLQKMWPICLPAFLLARLSEWLEPQVVLERRLVRRRQIYIQCVQLLRDWVLLLGTGLKDLAVLARKVERLDNIVQSRQVLICHEPSDVLIHIALDDHWVSQL